MIDLSNNKMEQFISRKNTQYWMGVATLLILLLHLAQNHSVHWSHKMMRYLFLDGDIGVNIFFFLSAYGCCHSWNKNNPFTFYLNRFKRLYPMIFVFMVFSYFINATFSSSFVIDMLCHATGVSLFYNSAFHDWFTPALVLMYFLFPLFYYFTKFLYNSKLGEYLIPIIAAIPSLLLILPQFHHFTYYLCLPRIGMVMIGISVFLAEQKQQKKRISTIAILCVFISITSIIKNSFFIVPCLLLFASFCEVYPLFEKFFSFLGKHSLEIYLAQCLFVFEFDFKYGNYYLILGKTILVIAITSYVLWAIQHYFWKFLSRSSV